MNMAELARACRLSKSAVSMALRDHPRISARTRERVQSAAKRLGFRVDPKVAQFMSALSRHSIQNISTPLAILSMFPHNYEWRKRGGLAESHRGLVERATELGFKTEDFWLADPDMPPRRMERILAARGIEAAIVFSYPNTLTRISIDLSPFACAVIGRALASPRLYAVDHDFQQGMFLALDKVATRGFDRPGLVLTEELNERTMHGWVAAYLFHSNQLPASKRVPVFIIGRKSRPAELSRWLARYRPDVILGHELVLPFLGECQVSIPDQVAFATLAWMNASPQYAGVDTRRALIAGRAVDIVLEQLRGNRRGIPVDPETVLLEGVWRDGPSVSKV